ncbi:hypothetical protein K4F52_008202 [Lecanicillium sp. MT-2017a]|nr:hypothetical protein K4F52_008202 [Lecanicillium sp. MT-2017a]
MSEDSSGGDDAGSSKTNAKPLTYVVIPLVAVLSIAFISIILYYRRRRYLKNGGTDYPEWPQDRFLAADGGALLHYPGGRHMANFTASISAANSLEAARRANALRQNSGFGLAAVGRHNHHDHNRHRPNPLPLPRWSLWGAMRSTEGLNELGEAPPPYDAAKQKQRAARGSTSSRGNPESDAERGEADVEMTDINDGGGDEEDPSSTTTPTDTPTDTTTTNTTPTRNSSGVQFSSRRRHRRRESNNDAEQDGANSRSQSRSRSRTPCRCRSQSRESFESAMALQDWLIPRVTDMNDGAMPPEYNMGPEPPYVAHPEPVVTAGPRGQPDMPTGGSGPSRQ